MSASQTWSYGSPAAAPGYPTASSQWSAQSYSNATPAPTQSGYPTTAGSTPVPSRTGTDATAVPTPAHGTNPLHGDPSFDSTPGSKPTGNHTGSQDPASTKTATGTTHHSSATTATTATSTVIQSAITQEVKTAMTHVISNVPWMKFRVHAEPDLTIFHTDAVFQQALTQISQVAATSIAHTITNEFTSQMETLIQSITKTAATQISTTLVQLIQELITVSTLTHCSTNAVPLIIPGIPDCITGDLVPYGTGQKNPGNNTTDPKNDQKTEPVAPPSFDTNHPTATTPDLGSAGWIWTKEATKPNLPPPGARPFRKTFTTKTPVDHLCIDITVDNFYTLYVNGRVVGSDKDWTKAERYQVTFPSTTTVTVAVFAVQDPVTVFTAGIAAAATVWAQNDLKAGVYKFATDDTWKTLATQSFPTQFIEPGFQDANWEPALVEGPFGMQPWVPVAKPTAYTAQNGPLKNNGAGIPDAPTAPAAKVIIT